MRTVWDEVSWEFIRNVDEYNKIPREPLLFEPYEAGDYFMLRRHPKRHVINRRTRERNKLTAKLQFRWTGPYRITEKLSPVLYKAMVHGKEMCVHAVNMKPKTENWHAAQLRTEEKQFSGRRLFVAPGADGLLVLKRITKTAAGGEDIVTDEEMDISIPIGDH